MLPLLLPLLAWVLLLRGLQWQQQSWQVLLLLAAGVRPLQLQMGVLLLL